MAPTSNKNQRNQGKIPPFSTDPQGYKVRKEESQIFETKTASKPATHTRSLLSNTDSHQVRAPHSPFGNASSDDTVPEIKDEPYPPQAFAAYVDRMGGTVLTRNSDKDSAYDFARRCAHGYTWGQTPLIISYCVGISDVIATINFVRNNSLNLAVRSGGHSSIGACSGSYYTVVLDVSNMKNMVFNEDRTQVTAGAGVTFGQLATQIEYLNETEHRELHCVTGGCDTVSISGFTMGGGYGITAREFGMGCDQVLEMTIVLADGSVRTVKKGDELFWALMGGTGGNFGVVTEFKLKVHQGMRKVTYFSLNYPISMTSKLFPTYQEKYCTNEKPKELSTYCMWFYLQRHEWSGLCISLRGLFHGTKEEARELVQDLVVEYEEEGIKFPIAEFTEGNYREMNKGIENDTYSGMDEYPDGEWKKCRIYKDDLCSKDIDTIVHAVRNMPVFAQMVNIVYCEPYGQTINSVSRDETAFVHRDSKFDLVVDSMYYSNNPHYPDSDKQAFKWMIDFFDALPGDNATAQYQNYPDPSPDAEKTYAQAYFAENYSRLQQVKAEVDPDLMFTMKQMIHPPSTSQQLRRGD